MGIEPGAPAHEATQVDMLADIFKLQEQLNNRIFAKQGIKDRHGMDLTTAVIQTDIDTGNLGPNGFPNLWLQNYLKALEAEGEELKGSLLWKWWSKDKIDIQNIRVEIVDMMHFLVSLGLVAGLNASELHRLYTAKHRVNEQRQEAGYNQATKTEADNKTIV